MGRCKKKIGGIFKKMASVGTKVAASAIGVDGEAVDGFPSKDSGRWIRLDDLPSFEQDVRFVKELKEKVRFNQTCAIAVFDTDEKKQTKLRKNRKNKVAEEFYKNGEICGEKFTIKDLYSTFKYHIITF